MRAPVVRHDPGEVSVDLDDAREALAYWEDRARRLPRRARRQRREALEMAARWRARVTEAERLQYGRGLLGTLLLVVFEGRLPETARHTGRVVARRSRQVAIATLVLLTVLVVASLVAIVELLASLG